MDASMAGGFYDVMMLVRINESVRAKLFPSLLNRRKSPPCEFVKCALVPFCRIVCCKSTEKT